MLTIHAAILASGPRAIRNEAMRSKRCRSPASDGSGSKSQEAALDSGPPLELVTAHLVLERHADHDCLRHLLTGEVFLLPGGPGDLRPHRRGVYVRKQLGGCSVQACLFRFASPASRAFWSAGMSASLQCLRSPGGWRDEPLKAAGSSFASQETDCWDANYARPGPRHNLEFVVPTGRRCKSCCAHMSEDCG